MLCIFKFICKYVCLYNKICEKSKHVRKQQQRSLLEDFYLCIGLAITKWLFTNEIIYLLFVIFLLLGANQLMRIKPMIPSSRKIPAM